MRVKIFYETQNAQKYRKMSLEDEIVENEVSEKKVVEDEAENFDFKHFMNRNILKNEDFY